MLSTAVRSVVRFAVHLTTAYRANYLAELAENTGADARELSNGSIEITGFSPNNSSRVLDALQQEQARGALTVEDFS